MKKAFTTFQMFLLVSLACLMAGCDAAQNNQQAAPPGQSRITDTWIGAEDSKGVQLDANLLRKNYYVVFDCSGSMEASCGGGGSKIDVAKVAIGQFASLLPKEAGLGLLIFDERGVNERVPLDADNRGAFQAAVNNAHADGGTPLSQAITLGYEKLRAQAKRQLGYGEYYLVVVTDGDANPGCDPTSEVNTILGESPVVIYTIGLCIGPTHSLNQNGRTIYKDAHNPGDLKDGLQEILAESEKL